MQEIERQKGQFMYTKYKLMLLIATADFLVQGGISQEIQLSVAPMDIESVFLWKGHS